MVLKEHSSEPGSAQQGTAESPLELPAESNSLCAQDSLSLNDSQEVKVSLSYRTVIHLYVETVNCKVPHYRPKVSEMFSLICPGRSIVKHHSSITLTISFYLFFGGIAYQ